VTVLLAVLAAVAVGCGVSAVGPSDLVACLRARHRARRLVVRAQDQHDGDRGSEVERCDALDVELVMVLVAAALRSGASIPRALEVVAVRLPERQRTALQRVGAALRWGSTWAVATAHVTGGLASVLVALAPAWESGASPDGALRLWSDQLRRRRQSLARESAARLAVHLVVPLGLCSLPAFVLLGLVPLVVSFGLVGR